MIKTILEDIRRIKSTRKQLREFGLVMGIFFLGLAVLFIFKHRHFFIPGLLGSFFILLAFVAPELLLAPQKAWMTLAVVIGFFMSRILLSALFFLILTPLSFFSKIFGKKFLDAGPADSRSYWVERPKISDKKSYENQY